MGSNPTHLTPALSHGVQAGRFWSHRFFRSLHLLHAETLRNEEVLLNVVFAAELVEKVELDEIRAGAAGISAESSRTRLWLGENDIFSLN